MPKEIKEKKKVKGRIKFGGMPDFVYIPHGGFMSHWCCKCKTRHIWHFYIVRGKKRKNDVVEITMMMDKKGTKLRKFYERISN